MFDAVRNHIFRITTYMIQNNIKYYFQRFTKLIGHISLLERRSTTSSALDTNNDFITTQVV